MFVLPLCIGNNPLCGLVVTVSILSAVVAAYSSALEDKRLDLSAAHDAQVFNLARLLQGFVS